MLRFVIVSRDSMSCFGSRGPAVYTSADEPGGRGVFSVGLGSGASVRGMDEGHRKDSRPRNGAQALRHGLGRESPTSGCLSVVAEMAEFGRRTLAAAGRRAGTPSALVRYPRFWDNSGHLGFPGVGQPCDRRIDSRDDRYWT